MKYECVRSYISILLGCFDDIMFYWHVFYENNVVAK